MSKRIICIMFFYIYAFANASSLNTAQLSSINDSSLINASKEIANTGVLLQNEDGFIYLKISTQFQTKLYPILISHLSKNNLKCLKPSVDDVNSHISIFYSKALTNAQIKKLPLGTTFNFRIESLSQVTFYKTIDHRRIKNVWYVINVKSIPLEEMRAKYLNKFYPLHISIAHASILDSGECK